MASSTLTAPTPVLSVRGISSFPLHHHHIATHCSSLPPSTLSALLSQRPTLSFYIHQSPFTPNSARLIHRRKGNLAGVTVKAMRTATPMDTQEQTSGAVLPKNLYHVLGVSQSATEREIRSAYRNLARRNHPDVVPEGEKEVSTKAFLQIHAAYAVLSNPDSRARYDLQLSMQKFQSTGYGSRAFSKSGGSTGHDQSVTYYTSSDRRSPFSTRGGRSWETDQCWC